MEVNDKIIEILTLKGEPMKSVEISETSGIEKKEIDKAIKKMVSDDILESPKRCFYQPKNNG